MIQRFLEFIFEDIGEPLALWERVGFGVYFFLEALLIALLIFVIAGAITGCL